MSRKIVLKMVKEDNDLVGKPIILTTFGLLKEAINNRPEKGFTIEEMQMRLDVMKKLNAYKDIFHIDAMSTMKDWTEEKLAVTAELELEKEEYKQVQAWVRVMPWGIISEFVIDFVNSLKD